MYQHAGFVLSTLAIVGGVVLVGVAARMVLARRDARVIVAEVVHVGATERWSPEAQIAAVPWKPIGPEEAKRVAEDHEAAVWEDQQRTYAAAFRDLEVTEQRAIDDTFEGLIRRANRIGHLERDTCEITSELMAEVLGRAGR